MAYPLCAMCFERHKNNPEAANAKSDAECFICKGGFASLRSLVDSALAVSEQNKFSWETFSVRSTIKRDVLVREEELFDFCLLESMSAKNQTNRIASDYIVKKTGKMQNATHPDIIFSLDFMHGKSSATPTSVFLLAHYRKLSRSYCQHEWVCGSCRGRGCPKCNSQGQKYPSVEGSIKSVFAPAFGASDVLLHAAGREDVDVMMEGGGRPCVIEIVHPAKRNADIAAATKQLAATHPIELLNPTICPSTFVESVCTSHFDKKYRVWVEAPQEIGREKLQSICASAPILLHQRTPNRVSARRADLVRKRKVLSMEIVSFDSNSSFCIDMETEAGTYIKEFVHGDEGRTNPNLSSLLGMPCKCKQLNVTLIHDDFIYAIG